MAVQFVPIVMAGVKMAKWMKPLVRRIISANKKGSDLQKYRTKLIETYGHAKNDVNKAFKLAKDVIKNQAKPKVIKPKKEQIKMWSDKLGTEAKRFNPRIKNPEYTKMLRTKIKEGVAKKKLSGNRVGGSVSRYSRGGGVRTAKYKV